LGEKGVKKTGTNGRTQNLQEMITVGCQGNGVTSFPGKPQKWGGKQNKK